jgi:hypothetical protein
MISLMIISKRINCLANIMRISLRSLNTLMIFLILKEICIVIIVISGLELIYREINKYSIKVRKL